MQLIYRGIQYTSTAFTQATQSQLALSAPVTLAYRGHTYQTSASVVEVGNFITAKQSYKSQCLMIAPAVQLIYRGIAYSN